MSINQAPVIKSYFQCGSSDVMFIKLLRLISVGSQQADLDKEENRVFDDWNLTQMKSLYVQNFTDSS